MATVNFSVVDSNARQSYTDANRSLTQLALDTKPTLQLLRQSCLPLKAIQLKHDFKLEQTKLNKEIPEIEFKLNSEDSYLLIRSVVVTSPKNTENEWTKFISKVKLIAELKYVVYGDQQQRFIDERKKQLPIYLTVDQYQVQPIIHQNKLIKNETFTLGINPDRKFYRTLKLALQDVENLDEEYTLEFNIEKFNIDD